jgi:hypothetical protein
MAAFNLTAELNIRGPSNLGRVVADIRRQLSSISLDVTINPSTSRGIQAVTSDVRNLSTALREAQTNAVALGAALRGIGGSFNNLSSDINNIGNNLGRVSTQSSAVSGSIRAASSEMAEFGKQSALAIRRFAAFSVATGSVYALSKAVTSAYNEFVNFNKEFIRLQQVTDTTKSGLSGLSSEITRLSTSLGVSSSELLNVSVTLAQAGLSAGETKQALEALAKSALAPSFDNLNDTVEGSIALMRQFGIGAGNLESALGSVNAVAAKFAVEAKDIIAAIQRTGGVFANASKGVSEGKDALNEFLAVFTSVRATTRESAETIATGLRTIFTRIQRVSTIDALKDFGIVLTDLEGKFVGPFEAVRRLSEGLKTLDPRDLRFSKIVEELGGFRQIGKVIPLIQQFAVAQQALSVAQKGSGSLAADAATAQEALAVRITKVREQFIALVRDIGQSSSFQAFADVSLKIASALISVADAAKDVAPAIAAIVAIRGIGALGQFFSGFSSGVSRRPRGFSMGGYVPGSGRVKKFAHGGMVPGSGNGDIVPSMLEPGEFVMRKKAVSAIGANNLHKMNRYASGSMVKNKNAKKPTNLSATGPTEFTHIELSSAVVPKKLQKWAKSNGIGQISRLYTNMGLDLPKTWNRNWAIPKRDNYGAYSDILSNYIKQKDVFKTLKQSNRIYRFTGRSKSPEAAILKDNHEEIRSALSKKLAKNKFFDTDPDVDAILPDLLKKSIEQVLKEDAVEAETLIKGFEQVSAYRVEGKPERKKISTPMRSMLKSSGGFIKRFASGGLSKAPLIDDILQASGTILPKPSEAIQALIQAGGGALDVDRTLKRTIGDKAYSSAKSGDAKNQVLSRYFRNDKQRLEDIQSSPLTAFGKELLAAISSKQLDPKNLSIISKSQRTKGVPEYLHKLFGIPMQNMIFTQGGDKQPALDAIRNKGPRSNRVFKNLGGFIQRFNIGGIAEELKMMGRAGLMKLAKERGVPFDANILDPRKKLSPADQSRKQSFLKQLTEAGILQSNKAANTSKIAQSRRIAVVGITGNKGSEEVMIPGATDRSSGAFVRGVPATLEKGVLPPAVAKRVQARIRAGIERMVREVTEQISKAAGTTPNLNRKLIRSISSKDIEDISGPIFEKALGAAGGNYDPFSKAIDFPFGLEDKVANLVGITPGVMTDATNNTAAAKRKLDQFGRGRLEARKRFGRSQFSLGGAVQGFNIGGEASKPELYTRGSLVYSVDDMKEAAKRKGITFDQLKAMLEERQDNAFQDFVIAPHEVSAKLGLTTYKPQNSAVYEKTMAAKFEKEDRIATWKQKQGIAVKDYEGRSERQKGFLEARKERRGFASGGSVPAMVSNGEAYVPPKIAKRIGYSTLNRMNQADRNGITEFSSGGISVFKGPGSGTSDSIPANLPVGSFIIREKATKSLGLNKGGFVKRFDRGGSVLPARPDDPTRLNTSATSTAIAAINEVARALEALGLSASASARLVEAGGAISIRTSETALQRDTNRLRIAGASATDIYRAEQQLARVRADNANKLNAQQVMSGASGATLQNIATGAEEERQRLLNQRRTTMAARGRTAAEIEETLANDTNYQDYIRRRSYETATRQVTGVSARSMGVTGTDIEQQINQSMMDRRTLAQMDTQLINTRQQQLRSSVEFSTASRSEQNRMLRELRARNNEEINQRRQIVTDLAKDRGFSGGSGRVTRGLQTTGALFGVGSFRETETPGGGLGGRLNRFSAGAQRFSLGLSMAGGIIGDTIGNAVGGKTGKGIGAAAGAFASSVGVGAMFGPMGVLIGVLGGATSAIKSWKDAVADATLAEEQENTEKATLKVEKAFERLEKSTNKTESRSAIKDIGDNLGTIVKSFNVSTNAKTDTIAVTPGIEGIFDIFDPSRVGNSIADASYGVANILNELGSKATNFIGARLGISEDRPLNFGGFKRETDRSAVEKEIGGLARASEVNRALPRLVEQSLRKGQTMADLETELGPNTLSSMKEMFAIAQGDNVASGFATNIAVLKDKLKDTTDPAERTKIQEQININQKGLSSRGDAIFNNDIKKNIVDKIAAENKAAAAAAAATIKINLFSEVLNDIGGAVSKAGAQFESAQRKIEMELGSAFGDQIKMMGPDRAEENVLENIRAYSVDEIQKNIGKTGADFGFNPEVTKEAQGAATNKRILETELPKILAEVAARESGGFNKEGSAAQVIRKQLSSVLKGRVSDPSEVLDKLMNKISEKVNSRQAPTVSDLIQEDGSLGDILSGDTKTLEIFGNLIKEANDKVASLTAQFNRYSMALNQATELQIQKDNVGIEGENQLIQALGGNLSLSELNSAFENSISVLTSRIGADGRTVAGTGTLDPKQIQQRMLAKEAEAANIQKQLDKEKPPIDSARFKELNSSLARTTAEARNLQTAHQKLATDSSRASNALAKISEIRQRNESRQTMALELLKNAANPEWQLDFVNSVDAFQMVMSGQNVGDEGLEKAVQGLEYKMRANPADAQAIQEEFIQKAFKQIEDRNPGMKQELLELLKGMGVGANMPPEMQALVDEFYKYNQIQQDAIIQSADRIVNAGQIFFNSVQAAGNAWVATVGAAAQKAPVEVKPLIPVKKARGGVVYAQDGGHMVNFQPKGTDTVPAMLTPGEFVVNRKAAAKNAGLLKSINNGAKGYSKGGVVYLADGGVADGEEKLTKEEVEKRIAELRASQQSIGSYKELPNGERGFVPVDPKASPQLEEARYSSLQNSIDYWSNSLAAPQAQPAAQPPEKDARDQDSLLGAVRGGVPQQNGPVAMPDPDMLMTPAERIAAKRQAARENYLAGKAQKRANFLANNPLYARAAEKQAEREEGYDNAQQAALARIRKQQGADDARKASELRKGKALAERFNWKADSAIGIYNGEDRFDPPEVMSLSQADRDSLSQYQAIEIERVAKEERDKKAADNLASRQKSEADAKAASEKRIRDRSVEFQAQQAKDAQVKQSAAKQKQSEADAASVAKKAADEKALQESFAAKNASVKARKKQKEEDKIKKQQDAQDLEEREIAAVEGAIQIDPVTRQVINENPEQINARITELQQAQQAKLDRLNKNQIKDAPNPDDVLSRFDPEYVKAKKELDILRIKKAGIDRATSTFAQKRAEENVATEDRYEELKALADKKKLTANDAREYATLAIKRGIKPADIAGGAALTAERRMRDESLGEKTRIAIEKKGLKQYRADLQQTKNENSMAQLEFYGEILGTPGKLVRTALATGSATETAQALIPGKGTSGRDLLRSYGLAGKKNTYGNAAAGFFTELATDPISVLGATKAGVSAARGVAKTASNMAARTSKAAKMANRPRTSASIAQSDWLKKNAPLATRSKKELEEAITRGQESAVRFQEMGIQAPNFSSVPSPVAPSAAKAGGSARTTLKQVIAEADTDEIAKKYGSGGEGSKYGGSRRYDLIGDSPGTATGKTNQTKSAAALKDIMSKNTRDTTTSRFFPTLGPIAGAVGRAAKGVATADLLAPAKGLASMLRKKGTQAAASASTKPSTAGTLYKFSGVDSLSGKNIQDIVMAASDDEALRIIKARGIMTTRLQKQKAKPAQPKTSVQAAQPKPSVQAAPSMLKKYKVESIDAATGKEVSHIIEAISPEDVQKQLRAQGYLGVSIQEQRKGLIPNLLQAAGMRTGGVVYAAKGQLIPFTPRGTDTVPAMLTPGEFVINRSATQKHLPLLKAINNNEVSAYAKGGQVKRFQYGGMADQSSGGGGGVSNIGLDTSGLDTAFNSFSANVESLKSVMDTFATAASSMSAGFSQLSQLESGANRIGTAAASISSAAQTFGSVIANFNTSISTMQSAFAKIPSSVDFRVSGSVPINITVDVNGGDGLQESLATFQDQIFTEISNGIRTAMPGVNISFTRTV